MLVPEAAFRDIGSDRQLARVAAAESLGRVPAEQWDRALCALALALTDDHVPVCRAAAQAMVELLEIGAKAAPPQVDALVRTLKIGNTDDIRRTGDKEVAQWGLIALGHVPGEQSITALGEALRGDIPELRFQAAASIGRLGHRGALDVLVTALAWETDDEVVGAIAQGLCDVAKQSATREVAVAALVQSLERSESSDSLGIVGEFHIAYALAHFGDRRGLEGLIRALDDVSRGWDAAVALESLGAADALADGLGRGRDITQLRSAAGLLRVDPEHPSAKQAQRLLLGGLASRRHELRALAVECLTDVGGAWATDALQRLERKWSARRLRYDIARALIAIRSR